MTWLGLTSAIAVGNAATPLVRLLGAIILIVILAGLWGVVTGAGE